MPDALDKIQAGADKARAKLAAKRLGNREFDVKVAAFVPGDDLKGTPGTWGAAVTLSPRPSVEFKEVRRWRDGGLTAVGNCIVSGISRSYAQPFLQGANGLPSRWEINGVGYTVTELKQETTEWVAILQTEAR